LLAVTAVGPTSGVRVEVAAQPETRKERDVLFALPEMLCTEHVQELWMMEGCCFLPMDCSPRGLQPLMQAEHTLLKSMHELDRVVVYGNMSSVLSHMLFNECNFSTYHVLFGNHPIDASFVHDELAEQKGRFGARHLVAAYLPVYQGEKVDWTDLSSRFETIQSVDLQEVPIMKVPELCMTSTHIYWPPWM